MVEGLVLTFAEGRIVDARADRGGEAIVAESTATRTPCALAKWPWPGRTSRVREAGVIFHDTLYDENAGAHVAGARRSPSACRRAQPRTCSTQPRCTRTWSSVVRGCRSRA